jgi:N-acetylneuraminate synthase
MEFSGIGFPRLIAEIGINHDGDVGTAKKLIRAAASSGADAVKFQYRNVDRSHHGREELGDEILFQEILRTGLDVDSYRSLLAYAKELGLLCGISFFTQQDILDFDETLAKFDFFKVPSAEMENYDLVIDLLDSEKPVLISTGMHSLDQVKRLVHQIKSRNNWILAHCVSNYPTNLKNASLGNIRSLIEISGREVGYSSHDQDWRTCLVALGAGATLLERHIAISKFDRGLDNSSSSDPDEFAQLSKFWQSDSRVLETKSLPNTGELINLQNLGRSYYAKMDIKSGMRVKRDQFEYESPRIGLGPQEFASALGSAVRKEVKLGAALNFQHLQDSEFPSGIDFEKLNKLNVGLPVRLHDLDEVQSRFPLSTMEYHLSFGEIQETAQLESHITKAHPSFRYAVHAPDYADGLSLLDPFSSNIEVAKTSQMQLETVLNFAAALSQKSGSEVPVVMSFTSPDVSYEDYLDRFLDSFSRHVTLGAVATIQWMPPYAWYFGGSVEVLRNRSWSDGLLLKKMEIPLTFDTSHAILSSNQFGFDAEALFDLLEPNIKHIHLSDAEGEFGEGAYFNSNSENLGLLMKAIRKPGLGKTIEVWQGHLGDFAGFKTALEWITAEA